MDKAAAIQAFKKNTGLDYFSAMETYFMELGTNLICLSEDDLELIDDKVFEEGLNKLYSLTRGIEDRKLVRTNSAHYKELTKSFIKTTSPHPKTSGFDLLMMNLIDKDKVIDSLCKNPRVAFNPLMVMNDWKGEKYNSILVLSARYYNTLGFLETIYNGTNAMKHIVINKAYEVSSVKAINKNDIQKVYWNMYTPYVRWLIQTEQFSKLIIPFDELKKNIS